MDSSPGGVARTEDWPDGAWKVREVSGSGADRPYRCPGCDQQIQPGTPHVVAWPEGGVSGIEDRRHWHRPCWRGRMRRQPRWRPSR